MRRLVVLLSLALLGAAAVPATAHSYSDPALRTVLDDVRPGLPSGVVVAVRPSVVDELVLTNPTAPALEVLGRDGRPFLRISRAGVLVDLAHPDWYATALPEGSPRLPSGVSSGAVPRWARVSRGSTWSEFDPRLRPAVAVSRQLRLAGRRRVLATWTIPLRYGGRPVAAEGHVLLDPVRGGLVVAVTGQVPGVTAAALQGELPGLFLQVPVGREVVVLGRDGLPFLRFRPGRVEVQAQSPSWREDQAASGRAATGSGWQLVGTGSGYSWLDARLRYPQDTPSDRDVGHVSVVQRWRVPLVVDGRPGELLGTVTWVPRTVALRASDLPGRARVLWWWFGGLAVVVGGLLARGRRRSRVEEQDR